MQRKIMYGIVVGLFAAILMGNYVAYALEVTISGTVKNTQGTLIASPKVTAEAPSSYKSTVGASNGAWSMLATQGTTYDVDAMKYGYSHERVSGVVPPQSGISHTLASLTTATIDFFIVADEEFRNTYGSSWQTTAKNKLFSAEPYFKDEHTIAFFDRAYYTTWHSDTTYCADLLSEVKSETGWSGGNYQNSDILAAFTGQSIPDANACANVTTGPGQHPGLISIQSTSDMARTMMNELSHTYGLSHHNTSYYCIMANDQSLYIKNWQPSMDDTMKSRRTWY